VKLRGGAQAFPILLSQNFLFESFEGVIGGTFSKVPPKNRAPTKNHSSSPPCVADAAWLFLSIHFFIFKGEYVWILQLFFIRLLFQRWSV
jgi:hypothetical protein